MNLLISQIVFAKERGKLINIVVCKINKTQKEHANAFSKNRPIHSVKTYQLTQIAAKQKPRTALVQNPFIIFLSIN